MRAFVLILSLASLAGCGVAGQPSHPQETKTFEQRLRIGAAARF